MFSLNLTLYHSTKAEMEVGTARPYFFGDIGKLMRKACLPQRRHISGVWSCLHDYHISHHSCSQEQLNVFNITIEIFHIANHDKLCKLHQTLSQHSTFLIVLHDL